MNEAKVLGKRQNRIESGSIRKSITKFQGRERERETEKITTFKNIDAYNKKKKSKN